MQTDNLELKKLVYLYLMNYAKSQPDLAILAVNTFAKVRHWPLCEGCTWGSGIHGCFWCVLVGEESVINSFLRAVSLVGQVNRARVVAVAFLLPSISEACPLPSLQDCDDPNPLIRALAVRTMGCIRVDKITEYLCEPLRKCLRVRGQGRPTPSCTSGVVWVSEVGVTVFQWQQEGAVGLSVFAWRGQP